MNNPATIPHIQRTPKGLPKVSWCIETLKWAGWKFESLERVHDGTTGQTYRLHFVEAPNGTKHGLATWGLRAEALKVWTAAQKTANSFLTGSTP
jgi:hypothetical protein